MRRIARPLLRQIAQFACRRYRVVFVLAAAAMLLALLAASRLRFDTNVFHLLPPEAPSVRLLSETLEQFGSADRLLVVVRVPPDEGLAPYEAFVDRLGEELQALPQLEAVHYRVDDVADLVAEFLPRAMLFLDEEGRRQVEEQLSPEALESRAQEIRHLLTSPQGPVLRDLLLVDPLGLAPVVLDHLDLRSGGLGFDWTSGYLLSRDHRVFVLAGSPIRSPQDLEFDRELMAGVEGAIQRVDEEWHEIAPTPDRPAPVVEVTGRHLIALRDASVIRRDALVNAITALVGVLLLFLFAFRRLGPLLFAVVPLLAGLVLTFGFAGVTVGTLSSATSGVAALLIGLGIDFVIVSYGRYVEERRRGRDVLGALQVMSGSSGRAVFVGAVTTAATFYAFTVTEFVGLRQMGILTGTGILFCMVAVFLLLPAMLAWRAERHRRRRRRPRHYLHGFGTERLMRLSVGHPVMTLVVGAVLTGMAAVAVTQLRFEDSLAAMRPEGNRAVELREEVAERFGAGFEQMLLVVDGDTPESVLDRLEQAAAGARRLTERGVLAGWDSITTVLPPATRQDQALQWLEELRRRHPPRQIRERFARELQDAGLRAGPFERGLELTVQALSVEAPLKWSQLGSSATGRRLVERFLKPVAGGWRGVVYLYPPPERWRRQPPPAAERLAQELGPRVHLVGQNVVSEYLRRQVKRDAWIAAVLGLMLVAVLLWLDFRRLTDTLLSLVPLGVGILWMLGGMVLLGIHLNFYNVFVATMIVGIGVDYGVHMIHRYRDSDGSEAKDADVGLRETGKAIALAALSTVIGFGSLTLSHFPGLRTTGAVAILGALATALVAVTLLPAILKLKERGSDQNA